MNRFLIPVVLFAGLSVSTAVQAAPQDTKPPVVWHADPAQVSILGPEVQVQNYALHLPAALKAVPVSADILARLRPQGITPYIYGLVRQDGTREGIEIIIGTPTPKDASLTTRDQLAQIVLSQMGQRMSKFTHGKPEFGKVNGLTFERITIDGIGSGLQDGKRVHGIAFVADDNKTLISITSVDVEPYFAASLATAEAAMLTFHKR